MILLAASLLAASPQASLEQAAHALQAGRTGQAREMIRTAMGQGMNGPPVDRLLADLAFGERRWPEAVERYRVLLKTSPADALMLERAGLAALQAGDVEGAVAYLDRAGEQRGASWRVWNARGIAADRQKDWPAADKAYGKGLALRPESAVLLNNAGWSLLLRGRWSEAAERLSRAAALEPSDTRIQANAELAQAAIAARLPSRRAGESDAAFAARLNDAGVVAFVQGDRQKAVAAFTRALEASSQWFTRAANNLAIAEPASAP
ncbi:tetratricopeptide repeat protein [Sphingomonas sp. LHG3406-1]|uniref:tetratricopeptide repeat protein n=1 Tax=Sphingomonas sp. LHG3406-1 TaxID=2804617 RepID=UPI0026179806|nr:tetratricopeptide repeat protein [Sphingomonas sp. LHG3406-1]